MGYKAGAGLDCPSAATCMYVETTISGRRISDYHHFLYPKRLSLCLSPDAHFSGVFQLFTLQVSNFSSISLRQGQVEYVSMSCLVAPPCVGGVALHSR